MIGEQLELFPLEGVTNGQTRRGRLSLEEAMALGLRNEEELGAGQGPQDEGR